VRVILAVLVAVARVASAQPAKEVTREFQAGVDAFRLGKHDDARKHLERATQLAPKLPGPHRFLAAVAQAQGRFTDCVASARVAIELNPASQELADTRKLHDDCRRSAGRPLYGQELGDKAAIGVTANVSGATVKISGLVYGATPLQPRPIPAGAHEVELMKAGYLPATVSVTALAGIVTDVEVELEPDPAGAGQPEGKAKVLVRTMGSLELTGDLDAAVVVVDGKPVEHRDGGLALAPGSHVIDVRVPGKDPWRRRVVIAGGTASALTPDLEDTARRERIRRFGLPLLVVGGALGGFGGVALYKDWNALAAASFGGAAISIGIGIWAYARGQRPDLTGPPPLALIPVDGGVIASTGAAF
jgi:hypothetical protein